MLDPSHLAPRTRMLTRFAALITNVSLPPAFPPLLELRDRQVSSGYQWESTTYGNERANWQSWQDCPVALQLTGMANELIAMRVTHRSFRDQDEETDDLLLFRRSEAEASADLLEKIADQPAVRPRVWTLGETSQDVETCSWDQFTPHRKSAGYSTGYRDEPSLLDPAILRRPERFDRVIHFGNSSFDLRREYLIGAHAALAEQDLDAIVSATDGSSYALLRECFVLAAQTA